MELTKMVSETENHSVVSDSAAQYSPGLDTGVRVYSPGDLPELNTVPFYRVNSLQS